MSLKVADFGKSYFNDIIYHIASEKGYDKSRCKISLNLDRGGYIKRKIHKLIPDDCVAHFYYFDPKSRVVLQSKLTFISYSEYMQYSREYKLRQILD